ncbi:MAG TPA: hypothetical protein VGK41_10215 [Solirubrobacterales bacterium]
MGDKSASLKGPRLKLDRAKRHLGDLESVIERFFETDPYLVAVEDNSETNRREFRVVRAQPVPMDLSVIGGDAVHNLRSALDHLIWQLVLANGGKPNKRTAFPVWGSEADFVASRPGYAKGVSEEAVEVLYGLKPYKGGNDALWRIHQLDIVDKHRLLLAVAMRQEHVVLDMTASFNRTAEAEGWEPIPDLPPMPVALNPAEREIVEEGSLVFSAPLGDQSHDDAQFAFQIALCEPEVPIYEPVVKALHELTSFVDEVIDLFAPLIAE